MFGSVGRIMVAAATAGLSLLPVVTHVRDASTLNTASLLAPVRLAANGACISVDTGHAAPAWADIDGDGKNELLVGQYEGGKLRIYRNIGKDAKPQFRSFTWLQAGGMTATVPFG